MYENYRHRPPRHNAVLAMKSATAAAAADVIAVVTARFAATVADGATTAATYHCLPHLPHCRYRRRAITTAITTAIHPFTATTAITAATTAPRPPGYWGLRGDGGRLAPRRSGQDVCSSAARRRHSWGMVNVYRLAPWLPPLQHALSRPSQIFEAPATRSQPITAPPPRHPLDIPHIITTWPPGHLATWPPGHLATWPPLHFRSVRLASFLFFRVIKTSHDGRLDDLLSTIPGSATFWISSFLWGWLVISPQTMLAGSAVDVPLGIWGKAAAAVAVAGVLIEAAADFSKWSFKSNPANKGLFCNVGVWKWSQHPNYGE